MCPLDRAPVSPSEHNHHHEHVLENFGCTHIATVKEEAKKEQGEDNPGRTPLESELGNPLSLKDEPNTTTLGAPVYSAGEGMSPFVQAIEELRQKRQRLYKLFQNSLEVQEVADHATSRFLVSHWQHPSWPLGVHPSVLGQAARLYPKQNSEANRQG